LEFVHEGFAVITSEPDKKLNSPKTFLEVCGSPEPNDRDWKAWRPWIL